MKILIPLIVCGVILVGLLYRGVGAYLRDRERIAQRRRDSEGGPG